MSNDGADRNATAGSSPLPDFIAVGPPRTGTTWLDRVLRGHVGLPSQIKETQFFRWNHELGLDWYRSFFRDCPAGRPVGEIAPTYFDSIEARERIAGTIPRCKIICSLRDPVSRVYSQYKVWHRAGLIKEPLDFARHKHSLSASQSYASNVRAWQKLFGGERVLVVLYDDLRANPQGYLDSICDFIGIDRIDLNASPVGKNPINLSTHGARYPRLSERAQLFRSRLIRKKKLTLARLIEAEKPLWRLFFSSGSAYPPLDEEAAAPLRERLRPEIEELELVLGRDLSAWKAVGPASGQSQPYAMETSD